jgi:hypothetical protein
VPSRFAGRRTTALTTRYVSYVWLVPPTLRLVSWLTRQNEKPEIDFGPVIYDPALVEMAIRRAQLAILNPSIEPHNFVTYNIPDFETKEPPMGSKKQHEFSRSVIVLEIAGPDVTDLTLVDLPGIIQNVSKGEDPNNITLVQDLVKSYIARDCLILLVITMKGQSTCSDPSMAYLSKWLTRR